jgi:putative ATP-binding cassette transporter
MIVQMPSAVVVVVVALLAGVVSFVAVEKPGMRAERARHKAIVGFNDSITDLLRGYKELRLRHSRRSAMAARIDGQIAELETTTVRSERYFSYGNIAAMGSLAATLIAIVVVLPSVAGADSVTMLQLLTLVLFIFAPVEEMITGLPAIARSAVAFRIFRAMETTLAENAEAVSARDVIDNRPAFKTLELRGVTAHLSRNVGDTGTARDTFTLGPVNLTLYPGQSVFITGGNGMGKSTLLQLLTGLRHPDAGSIYLDGVEVTRDTVADYRGVFSAVFSEFYLFRHLFGLTEEERARLQEHITELGLGEGVSITGDEFDSLSLSTGQMRRLALSIALAEQRPIIVLDEFAADQDPARRTFFYDVLVPRLARAGHCVIAVTHDEHCFDKCDRLIRVEDGKIASDELQTPSGNQVNQI